MNSMKSTWIGIAFLLPFAAILFLNAVHYLPFLSDDSLISLRYAHRLLDGHGLTWTEGRPVEGYSLF
jgi:arabinofuranosyltransferase